MIEQISQRISQISHLTVGDLWNGLVHILTILWNILVQIFHAIAGKL